MSHMRPEGDNTESVTGHATKLSRTNEGLNGGLT